MLAINPTARYLLLCTVASLLVLASCKQKVLFNELSSSQTDITFNNKIIESDSMNPIDVTNFYNGGGVGVGDFNNDGLPDLYFTANMASNRLYLNKGALTFEDITDKSGVGGSNQWCRGVSVVDINNDGWQDIYVCVTLKPLAAQRQNLLYINQGLDKSGVPYFREAAAEYGLNDSTHSTMAAFFDYDNDGDLDMYLVVNEVLRTDNPAAFRPQHIDGTYPSTGRLYRNEFDSRLKHGVFKNVSQEAGITIEGFGHSVAIADINKDGWKDIFVANDFLSNDLLYINNRNGTFTNKAQTYFKHTSANGMGSDVIDLNNDGLSDLVELDMNPEDNYRKKMMLNANNYGTYQNSDYFHYQYQYMRNSVQLNQGPRVLQNDSIGDPVFSDIGFFSGIAETDWSWTPVVQDFDNDGFRDIIITNGFPKDVTDHDYVVFASVASKVASREQQLEAIPQVKLHNYAFRNNGDASFANVTTAWGFEKPTFSNGAVSVDLDNDGDLDVVVNNINDEASVYENTLMQKDKIHPHYLFINLIGDAQNRNGLGAWVELYYDGKQQAYEQSPYRGYLSTVPFVPHFGLDTVSRIDSLVIKWPNGKKQVLQHVATDQKVNVDIKNATEPYSWVQPAVAPNTIFKDVTDSLKFSYVPKEQDFIDFNIQKLLPHKFSEYGPALAAGDVTGDGLDDLIAGGAAYQTPMLFTQQPDGTFTKTPLLPGATDSTKRWEEMGITLFDADGDGDLDLYTASGGSEFAPGTASYADHIYVNNGTGNFTQDPRALPPNFTSKSCVRASDYDRDGDLDLFIAGRVEPQHYPKPVNSFVYRNDSKNGVVKFTDVTVSVAKDLVNVGLVCDAAWSDFDGDGWPDLVLAGEWMPVLFLKNEHGVLKKWDVGANITKSKGWWNSVLPLDFDADGDMDYVVGNLGLNSFYRASDNYPVRIYAKDFNNDGAYDAIPTIYLPASQQDTTRREFPVHVKDDMAKQMIQFRLKYTDYRSYATATFPQMLTADEMKDALVMEATEFKHRLLKNLGNGTFEVIPMPMPAQYSCINGMVADDFNEDGKLDVLAVGNDYGTEPSVGRYDACNGLFLKGDGQGKLFQTSILQSGWFVPGNAKALVKLRGASGNTLLAASQNRGPLKLFAVAKNGRQLAVQPDDVAARITLKAGNVQRQELNYGASFLSQSARFLLLPAGAKKVVVINAKGVERTVNLN